MSSGSRPRDDRFRLARVARGLSQEALASAAGVTRQAISGIEAGRFSPSLDVALAVATALGTPVEQLFGPRPPLEPVEVRMAAGGDAGEGAADRVRLLAAEVGESTVAYPLGGDQTFVPGFRPAHAESPTAQPPASVVANRLAAPGRVLAVAGCDPALALLDGPLQRHAPPLSLLWHSCGNEAARTLLADGSVHAAAVHRPAAQPARPARRAAVVGFAGWREGLVVAPAHAGEVGTVAAAVAQGLRLANREPGSEARRLLDDALADAGVEPGDVAGYATACTAHLLVASAIASGLADFGVAAEPAALAYGLTFVPWQDEVCELHVARDLLGSVEVRALVDVLGGPELPAQLAAIAGYDPGPCGEVAGDW